MRVQALSRLLAGAIRPAPRAVAYALALLIGAAMARGTTPVANSQAAALTPRSVDGSGVTVKATPPPALEGLPEWAFVISLDTHSQDLDDDLVTTTVLIADGVELKPLRWTGQAPAGHHREGVLVFPNPGSQPIEMELRMQRAGEALPRVLHWDLKR